MPSDNFEISTARKQPASAPPTMATSKDDVTERVLEWIKRDTSRASWTCNDRIFLSLAEGPNDDEFMEFKKKVLAAIPASAALTFADFGPLYEHVKTPPTDKSTGKRTTLTEDKRWSSATRQDVFTVPYIGDETVPAQFEKYIELCWSKYCKRTTGTLMYPYTAILQSSGFGKSRLLRELALRVLASDHCRVLYVCVREGVSSGFPERTYTWPQALFPAQLDPVNSDEGLQDTLSLLLQKVYRNALAKWATVGKECLKHFTKNATGQATFTTLTSEIDSVKVSCPTSESRRVLVLALDEARCLVKTSTNDRTGWFRRLRRALNDANRVIAKEYGQFAGIFAVLVDTNSTIANFTPPVSKDSSSRATSGTSVLFPPFILTSTMDIYYDDVLQELCFECPGRQWADGFYCQQVCEEDEDHVRYFLAAMGRPLWLASYSTWTEKSNYTSSEAWSEIIHLAGTKLLGGRSSLNDISDIDEHSLVGVGSLLCRVGIRPYSWSPHASQLVSDHMAVLSHITNNNEQVISAYASEPIVTFGAARVWYSIPKKGANQGQSLLESSILPAVGRLLQQEVLDTGGVGEFVARIVLLLAMDATGVVETADPGRRMYAGEFCSVENFMHTLSARTGVVKCQEEEGKPTPSELLAPWRDWCVGFSHFVQLTEEPTREVLWALLTRRAACALPRGWKDIDLLIPIFCGDKVSMIFVQVKNREVDSESNIEDAALIATRPNLVFKDELKDMADADVLRVYMSLRATKQMERSYRIDPGVRKSPRSQKQKAPRKQPFVLCLLGLEEWSVLSTVAHHEKKQKIEIPVVTEHMIKTLKPMLTPWVKMSAMVEADVTNHGDRQRLSQDEVVAMAMKPLAEKVIQEKWADIRKACADEALAEATAAPPTATACEMPLGRASSSAAQPDPAPPVDAALPDPAPAVDAALPDPAPAVDAALPDPAPPVDAALPDPSNARNSPLPPPARSTRSRTRATSAALTTVTVPPPAPSTGAARKRPPPPDVGQKARSKQPKRK